MPENVVEQQDWKKRLTGSLFSTTIISASCSTSQTVLAPGSHQFDASLQVIRSPVCGANFILVDMRQGGF
jgi:hypothetical protein